ncbi:5-methyltetrahydropteroyltriglutamate--homocysteine S-methyltransferase [Aerococcaceae bacterium zg-ZUI334]|uniref:5-methyltetrahydropteroyltriglutamate-- homocysteine S-methyltransferase n=1 Tax=Aerococcaceae TaxID=186827 RepID=UPI0013BD4D68|nr:MULTISPECIES: 5-methyltetrahydropteroyltriglutamate--homocysteine S-methyltransferase [unclassified Facklamia]MBR7927121.1 5-methyltetrahydropteroyltriglutamate--homocysteine S-methyltransferase [Aerococcaceae bacterium zg-ZUI334]NEW63551.1 5-methyltetrahydropteroyltriglutamate--homocysteine S-methyltransferase [Facklamia sp. 252]NEW67022.1 5-methyltetrahydropteroyltriglutamate--homocysteine S-methyltransferase [Facklamia sp. 253]QQD66429.1 5-methyltetrahydropteroyltriglutamate--homocysteine
MSTNCQCHNHSTAPFRVDHVGSFLRPERLVKAREAFNKGELTREALREVEDELIKELVDKQIEVGLKGITDGEFRRAYWHLDFFWGLNGVEHTQAKEGLQFHDEVTKADSCDVVAKISGENHPFVKDYLFLKEVVGDRAVARQSIPAPAQFYFELIHDEEHVTQTYSIYEDKDSLFKDIIAAYKTVIQDLYDAGLRNLQIDDCTWGAIIDNKLIELFAAAGGHTQTHDEIRTALATDMITLNNGILTDLPEDLVVNTHVCRGNFRSTWVSQGGYDSVADKLFGEENVNGYYLEYDTDRAGDFTPLAKVTDGKKVVLGLITSKFGELEDKETIIARIKEAAQYVPLENLHLSPQCGFASTEEGNKLSEEQQWAKIKLINEIAEEVWG